MRRDFIKQLAIGTGLLSTINSLDLSASQLKNGFLSEAIEEDLWPELPKMTTGHDNNGLAPTITWYWPKNNEPVQATVCICPGGGYRRHANHEGHDIAVWLNERGYAAAVVKYTVSPKNFIRPYQDVTRAISLIRGRVAEKPDQFMSKKVGLWGFSAGGHVASTVAVANPDVVKIAQEMKMPKTTISIERPDFLILAYAVISMNEAAHMGSVMTLLNMKEAEINKPEAMKLRQMLSNQHHIKEGFMPTYLFHTADDPAVPADNAIMFAHSLATVKARYALHIYPKGRHGVGLAKTEDDLRHWPFELERWLASETQF